MKYFNLAKPIQIKSFKEFHAPMGWKRLDEKTISTTKGLTKLEKLRLLKATVTNGVKDGNR